MPIDVTETTIQNILTRTTGFLRTVTSHSLQPYCGCAFGNALCGVGCYVRHNGRLLRGRPWGGFLEVRTNAAESYLANYDCESRWARRQPGAPNESGTEPGLFSVFCSSSTDPFVPQEGRYRATFGVLHAMRTKPPDRLILQTHSHRVVDYVAILLELSRVCELRIHVSIETDRERIAGLPPSASSVENRLRSCARLKEAGLWTVVTVAPLLPIADPDGFFGRIAAAASAVVIDHFIGGDGSADGSRTGRTALPAVMRQIEPESVSLSYRDRMVAVARKHLPGRVGVNVDGFAGRYFL